MKKYLIMATGLVLVGCGASKIDQTVTLEKPNTLTPEMAQATEKARESYLDDSVDLLAVTRSMQKEVTYLASDALQGRAAGTDGIAEAASFIIEDFSASGIRPYFESYRDTLSNFTEGDAYNIVGVLPGTDPELKNEYIIIGAHYDHIGIQAPTAMDTIANGANDNASGTATVMELARFFGEKRTNKRSLLFVLFSAEEKGLLGSKHLAEKLKAENMDLYLMLNFEMVGVPLQGKDYLAYVTGFKKSNLANVANGYAGSNLIGYLPTAEQYQLFKRSDNYPFDQAFQVPSQTFCTFDFTNFDHYHKVTDESALMDFDHMANFVAKIAPVVLKITNAPTKEIQYY